MATRSRTGTMGEDAMGRAPGQAGYGGSFSNMQALPGAGGYQMDPLNPGQQPPRITPDPGAGAGGSDWFSSNMPSATQQPSNPQQGVLSGMYGSGGNTYGGAGNAPTGGYGGTFTAPQGVDFTNDPAYRFNAQELNRGVQNSQFAKGQGLTGGALKDLQRQQSGLAANTYQQVFNNQMAGQGFNRDTAFGNQDRALNSYVAGNQAGLNAYMANRDTYWGDTDRLFGRNFSLASLGQNAASGYGNNLGQYGANGGNLYTNQGNSNASSTIGQANAMNNGIQNGVDIYAQYRGGR